MPPPGSPLQSSAGLNHTRSAEPYYSNDDVALLHDIVVLAQEMLPKLSERERLPTNALFSAYYDVLPRIGINADHDSRYARVLFKIGGLRGPGTLYEKFEEILSRMGIEIEFDQENNDTEISSKAEDLQQASSVEIRSEGLTSSGDTHGRNVLKRQRRNSESSVWGLGVDFRSPTTRRNSFSTLEKLKSRNQRPQDVLQEVRFPTYRANINRHIDRDEDVSTYDLGTWLNSRSPNPRRNRGRSVSTHTSMRIRRRSISNNRGRYQQSVPASEDDHGETELTAVTSSFGEKSHLLNDDQTGHENLMETKASLVLRQRLDHSMRQKIRNWRDKALELREDLAVLELLALRTCKDSLLRAALVEWRKRYCARVGARDRAKQISAESKKFYAYLEQRASEARGLYLLHTAFSHWSSYANEHVQRTALARRHIVRTKIFIAWKEITAVNELKVRRQIFRKFFSLWKRQISVTAEEATDAVLKYQGNLAQKVYRQWVRKIWDIRATSWWAEAAKRRALFRWIFFSHNNWESRRSAEETRRLDLIWNAWKIWRDQTEVHVRQEQGAETHHRKSLSCAALKKWRRETRVIPAKITIQSDVDSRRLREAFRIWLHRARREREAAGVDRTRILREALTVWRHKSRSRLLSARLDRRVAAQALYQWIVRDRINFSEQTMKQKLLKSCLQTWICKFKMGSEQTWRLEDMAQSFVTRKIHNAVLRSWHSRMCTKQRLESAASAFSSPRLLQGKVLRWSALSLHVQQLEQRSRDANFYFLTSKTLRRWKASTEVAKREKRKIAYVQVRRMTKMNLVQSVLETWRGKVQYALSLRLQASKVSRNKDVVIGMDIFDRWRARAEELAELDSLWRENVLKKFFTLWEKRTNAVVALETEAVITYQEIRTSRAIKRWSLLALQRGAHSNYAADVREKNAKKNFRKILSYWRHKTLEKRPRANKVEFDRHPGLDATERAEAWSDFGEEKDLAEWSKGLVEGASTSIPGYLSTPSKRSERVTAVAARYSTTPRAPLSTPFERQLRAQYSGGPLQSSRKPSGRSALGLSRGFADIPERSMNNDRRSRS
ncbi:centrin-binding protein Sfi1 [Diplocarpon rosae]|nr:centrin-binding protein Sfi1 [Diplocarpon rosae]